MANFTDTKSPYETDYRKIPISCLIDKYKQNYKNEHMNSREISTEIHSSQCTSPLSENEVGNGMREDKINSSTFNNNGSLHLPRNITAVMYLPLSA
jgi:hypothetical protein